jgi:hypothetical protein
MELWIAWLKAVSELRNSCSRKQTFLWMITVLVAFSIRQDSAGVTSFVRCLALKEKTYLSFLHFFHSPAVKLGKLRSLWKDLCFKLFKSTIIRIGGRPILIVDGTKISKEGQRMPGVRSLHQESTNNTKPEYIMGHHFECISLLVGTAGQFFSVPLISHIVEGVQFSKNKKKTIIDKVITLFKITAGTDKVILVADAYYSVKKIMKILDKKGHCLISRMRSNAVAWEPIVEDIKKRRKGRPKSYGKKIKLKTVFDDLSNFTTALSPVYDDKKIKIQYRVLDLILRPFEISVRIVCVYHPDRGKIILISTDRSIDALDIIKTYGLRFKIEVGFKQAVWSLGAYTCHFWMATMEKIKRNSKDQEVYKKDKKYQKDVQRKLKSHHVYVQLGLISQGLLIYLAVSYKDLVWRNFGSWFRTMKTNKYPSELVAMYALRSTFWLFLHDSPNTCTWKKFIIKKLDRERFTEHRFAA